MITYLNIHFDHGRTMKLCSGALLTENSAVYPFKRIATYPTPVLIKTIGMKDVNVYSDERNAILCTVFFQVRLVSAVPHTTAELDFVAAVSLIQSVAFHDFL